MPIKWIQKGKQIRGEFDDYFDNKCILSISPNIVSNDPRLRLGIFQTHEGEQGAIMVLTQEQVEELIYHLRYFSKHGSLPFTIDVIDFEESEIDG